MPQEVPAVLKKRRAKSLDVALYCELVAGEGLHATSDLGGSVQPFKLRSRTAEEAEEGIID